MYQLVRGRQRQALPRKPREQEECEVCRTYMVLIIKESVVLRLAIPPPGHVNSSPRRHEFLELFDSHVVIADMVIAGVVEPSLDHLPSCLGNKRRLKAR